MRKALEYSLDRKGLVNSVFNNWAEPACSPIAPDTDFATDVSNECVPYDPARSRSLLREAGVKTPLHLTMSVSNTPDTLRLAQAIQALVSKGGFDLEIQPVEYSTLLEVQTRGDFEVLQLGWSGRIDPHGNMYAFLATEESSNYSGYSNETVDRLMQKAARQVRPAVRGRTYGQVMEQVRKDDPIIYLYRQRNLTAYSTDVVGISTYADGVVRLGKAAFVKGS